MFQAIAKFFSNLFKSPQVQAFEAWCIEVFNAEKAQILNQLKGFAIAEVTALLSNLTITGDVKKAIAMANVLASAKTAGIIVATSDVSLAIEMALTGIKNAQNSGITINGQPAPNGT